MRNWLDLSGRIFSICRKKKRFKIKILDIGCGQGANLWFLAKENFASYGIDISKSAVIKTKKRLIKDWGVRGYLSVGNMLSLPYKSNSFDVVIDCASIQHVSFSEHFHVYKEIYRVLKSEGYFWSFHILEDSYGYGTGEEIDYKTFKNLKKGPLADKGVVTMCKMEDLERLQLQLVLKLEININ